MKKIAPAIFLLAAASQAHPGHASGFVAGLAHPWSGLDHLLAMLAVGVWASQRRDRSVWIAPSIFLAAMIAGFQIGWRGIAVPGTEPGIALGLVALGAAVGLRWTPGRFLLGALLGTTAFFHGVAHGMEAPRDTAGFLFGAGFVLSTAALHAGGIAIGWTLRERSAAHRWIGGTLAAAGAAFLLA
jgi:urease accessory protein